MLTAKPGLEPDDIESGTIYALRSHSTHPFVAEHRELIHKIGVTGGKVETRIAEADKDAKGIVLLKPYAEYYAEYQARVGELLDKFPLGQAIVGEAAQKAFIKLFGSILRLKNILTAFDDFAGNEILSERQYQDYQSVYLNLYAEFRTTSEAEKESINDDVVFEIELIKQVEINVDYILLLVEQYLKKKGSGEDK